QVGQRARVAQIVGLIVHELGAHHFVLVIVILVAADREVGGGGRKAAAIGHFLGPARVADIVGLPDEQGIDDLGGVGRTARSAGGVGEADGVVGQLQVGEQVILAAAPDRAVAVL